MIDFIARAYQPDGWVRARPDGRVGPSRCASHVFAMPPDALSDHLFDPYSDAVSRAFDRIGRAVVGIRAARKDGRPLEHGSSVVYTPGGYLLTNSHVIRNADRGSILNAD